MIAEHQTLLKPDLPARPQRFEPPSKGHDKWFGRIGGFGTELLPRTDLIEVSVRSEEDEQDLQDMERLVNGHDDAMDSLMQRHRERLFSHLVRVLRDKLEAQEAV